MKKLIILGIFFSTNAFSWTINNTARAGFPTSDITIKIGSDTCSNAGLTPSSLETIVKDAITDYWNKVPTSSLKLETAGNSGISLTADDLNSAAAKTAHNTILIGCSQNAGLFTSNSILGLGGIGCGTGYCVGVVLMNDKAGTNLGSVDRATVVTALSHEIGHAIGLGHSSIRGSIMYYDLTGKTQKTLHQDDIDGVSYLYPNKKSLGGLGGACGTIEDKNFGNKKNFLGSMLLGLFALFFFNQSTKKRAIN